MSPRLLHLLTTLRMHQRLEHRRDRIDARLATTRMGVRPPLGLHAVPDPAEILPAAA
jgi:hypothetical protein